MVMQCFIWKQLSIFSLLFLLVGCLVVPVRTPFLLNREGYTANAISDQSIKIITWNIAKKVRSIQFEEDLREIINTYNPDIILFQEFNANSEFNAVLENSGYLGIVFAPNLSMCDPNYYSGVSTVSQIRPHASSSLLSNGREPFTLTPKAVLFTEYLLVPSEEFLLVVNIHSLNFNIGTTDFRDQLEQAAKVMVKHKGPVIFAGDFNSWSEKRMNVLLKITKEAGLVSVNFGMENQFISSAFSLPLDHIFFNADFLILENQSPDVLENIRTSDHRPLFAEFKMIY